MQPAPGLTYAFGPFVLDPADRRFTRGGEPVPVSPKAFDVLVVLVERAGRLVTKEELLDAVWPGLVVEDNTLSVTVSRLRALLADPGRRGRYIETVTGHGYRFVATVDVLSTTEAEARPAQPYALDGDSVTNGPRIEDVVPALTHGGGDGVAPPVAPARRRPRLPGAALLAGTLALLALLFLASHERPAAPPLPSVPAAHQPPPEALTAYRQGRELWESRRSDAMSEALYYFRLASSLDSTFAAAYVGEAQVYATGHETGPAVEALLRRALALDSTVAEAWATLGFVRAFQEWDWQGAEAAFARARSLDPHDVTTLQWLASLRMVQRRLPEAETLLRRALALEPARANLHADLCEVLYYRRAYDDALAACDRALALEPEHPFAAGHQFWGLVTMTRERPEAADMFLHEFDLWYEHHPGLRVDSIRAVGDVDALLRGIARGFLAEPGTPNAWATARLYARLGQQDSALVHVEQLVDVRAFVAPFLNPDPVFDPYRDDPRWIAAVRRMGLE